MRYLIKEKRLELRYVPGKGAWTYHLEIPGTKDIQGKWGEMKVSGSIDGYNIEKRNLAPIKGADKLISVNESIRKAINKKGGEMVTVTLYLEELRERIDQHKIFEILKDADVFDQFEQFPMDDQKKIVQQILSSESEDKQILQLRKLIDSISVKGGGKRLNQKK